MVTDIAEKDDEEVDLQNVETLFLTKSRYSEKLSKLKFLHLEVLSIRKSSLYPYLIQINIGSIN